MAKAMIITVGTGRNREDIAGAISLSIKRENPDYVLFLTSPLSKQETIPCIEKTSLENRSVGIQSFEETDDVEIIYLNYVGIIRRLISDGYKREEINPVPSFRSDQGHWDRVWYEAYPSANRYLFSRNSRRQTSTTATS